MYVRTHPVPWVNRPEHYIRTVIGALQGQGLEVPLAWLDPSEPRDATILLTTDRALVWDEETGWRTGSFVAGRQGIRTELGDAVHLGGGVLPPAAEVAHRLTAGTSAPRRVHRSHLDTRDGFDDLF